MPIFRGMRITRGQKTSASGTGPRPPAGGPPPPPPPAKPFKKPAPPPARTSTVPTSTPAPRGPQLTESQKHNQWMAHHQSAIRDAQSIMRSNPVDSKAHRDADFAVRSHRDEMDRLLEERSVWHPGDKRGR